MIDDVVQQAYRSPDRESDEYQDRFHGIVRVFKEHFHHCPGFKDHQETHRFMAHYEAIRHDLWTKEYASEVLDDLKRAIVELIGAYRKVPKLVLDDLSLNDEKIQEIKEKRYWESNTTGYAFVSELPSAYAQEAADALATLYANHEDYLTSIGITRKGLPKGFSTRNRPLKEWALIEATVDVVRTHNAMFVPKSMKSSGPLFRLLRDVFHIFGIEKDSFEGVYGGWKKHMDSKFENADLLPI